MQKRASSQRRAELALRRYALGFPGAYEDFPWGERVVKVGKKVFVFMGHPDGCLSLSVKIPRSQMVALMLPFAEPTGYGLGKSGWVTARFEANDNAPEDLLREWIEESYRSVAPKKLVGSLTSLPSSKPRVVKAK
ncbi:MAG TPA: MmcQ/YjbR family DNA-binding protein [Vicinamibacteria bacterium]|nr:MmcQ/YjbR family DNA-binding protein [Vicinamibacteria bacterium]